MPPIRIQRFILALPNNTPALAEYIEHNWNDLCINLEWFEHHRDNNIEITEQLETAEHVQAVTDLTFSQLLELLENTKTT